MDESKGPAGGGFRLKAREFERVNEPAGSASRADPPPLGTRAAVRETNEVHDILRANAERDKAHGWYRVKPGGAAKLRRRIMAYVGALVAVDAPLSYVAWRSGHADPFPFVFALAGIAYFTAQLTWEAWFLRTD
jgi:hypothetical protein